MTQPHTNHGKKTVKAAILTVSDTRDKETDKSGKLILSHLENDYYEIMDYQIVKDDQLTITAAVETFLAFSPDIIIINGGTGIAQRDVTIEAVQSIIEKEVPGFGELFRMLSYQEDIGTRAILSRAIAGTIGKTAVFSIPGSSGAVQLAMTRLILPEINHIVFELNK